METDRLSWWQRGIIYEISVRSFMDSDGDGVGDLPGLARRLDYLADLGVDALWLTPIHPSPLVDFGYDVADYLDVHPELGSLAAFDRLIEGAHQRGLRIILDFVGNHTSDRHPWFCEARSSCSDPRRDWYIWRDAGPGGGPPNNWLSAFGGSAWTWDEATGQYYLHSYAREQPDLNWRNPKVEHAMHGVLRFWLDRGVDGFRLDAFSRMIKDDRFRDNPPDPSPRPGAAPDESQLRLYNRDRPEVHEVLTGLRRIVESYGGDRLLMGESYLPPEKLVAYHGGGLAGVHLPMNMQLLRRPWTGRLLATAIQAYEDALPGGAWPNWALGNHDNPRIATRIGLEQARIAAMLVLTLRGTPLLYYGDEIGMDDPPLEAHRRHDVPGLAQSRDGARTPMQWDASAHAGFTTGEPWLPVSPASSEINVAAEAADPLSLLTLYRRLIRLRRAEPSLTAGSWRALKVQGGAVLYLREAGSRPLMVALNTTADPLAVLTDHPLPGGRILLSTHLDRDDEKIGGEIDLRGHEGVIIAFTQAA